MMVIYFILYLKSSCLKVDMSGGWLNSQNGMWNFDVDASTKKLKGNTTRILKRWLKENLRSIPYPTRNKCKWKTLYNMCVYHTSSEIRLIMVI